MVILAVPLVLALHACLCVMRPCRLARCPNGFCVTCFCRSRTESRTDSQAELEAARIAGLSQASLVCRLNSLAYLLDALAAQDTTVRAWWYEVRGF